MSVNKPELKALGSKTVEHCARCKRQHKKALNLSWTAAPTESVQRICHVGRLHFYVHDGIQFNIRVCSFQARCKTELFRYIILKKDLAEGRVYDFMTIPRKFNFWVDRMSFIETFN